MSENAFLTWYEILQDKVLSAIDNVIATPVNNLIFFLTMAFKKTTSPDAKHPYPSVNNSRYAVEYKELVLAGTIISLIGSIVISFYKRYRNKESVSNYFFFERLFPPSEINNEEIVILRAAAYFYNPDISPMVLWLRRAWASLMGNSDLKNLEKYLAQTNKPKQKVLNEIYKKINEQLASFISNKKKYGEWTVEQSAENWLIKPPSDYVAAWQKKKELREKSERESKNSNLSSAAEKNFFSKYIISFINYRLDELGRASFVYWIGVFIFYFFPCIGVVGGTVSAIVWPPILVAGIFLGAIWIIKIYTFCQSNKQLKFDTPEKSQKTTIEFIAAVKQQIQLELLKQGVSTLSYKKIKLKHSLKDSKLCKDIRGVVREKCRLVGVRAIFNGFVIGCFTIYFSSWLLNSAALLVLGLFLTISVGTFTSVTTAVALITLVLGLAYGVYFAVRKYHEEMEKFSKIKDKFLELQQYCGDIEIPDISLRECDRFFRCCTTKPSVWTFIKQFFKRFWLGAIRLGTGILFLKLLPFGITTTLYYAFYAVAAIPAFYPMLVIMLTGGLFFAACHIWQYHCGSKEDQAVRIMDFFLNRPNDLEFNNFSSSPIQAENKEKNDLVESRIDDLLNTNKNYYQFLRRISSEPRLNDLNLNDVQSSIEAGFDDVKLIPKYADYIPQRKRSDTFPGTASIEQKRNADFVRINKFLNKKVENKPEALKGLMNKNGFNKILVRRISSEPCLDDDKDEKIIQNFKAIPQRKRSSTFPNAASFGRKRKVGIGKNYIEKLTPSPSRESLGL